LLCGGIAPLVCRRLAVRWQEGEAPARCGSALLLEIAELFGPDEAGAVQVLQAAESGLFVYPNAFAKSASADEDLPVVVAFLERQHEEQRFERVAVQAFQKCRP
jgi:hypothetical protein